MLQFYVPSEKKEYIIKKGLAYIGVRSEEPTNSCIPCIPRHLVGEGPESEPGLFSNPYCESGSRQLSKPAGCSDFRLAKQPSSCNWFFIVGWIRYYLLMKPKYIKALYETADVKKKSSWDSVKQKKIANRHVIFCYEIYFWLFKLQKSHYENSSFWGLPWNPVVKTLCFQFRGAGSIPGQGTMIPHVM